MTLRVTVTELKGIIETSVADDTLESLFIATANTFIDDQLASSGLSDAMLKLIELYLSAHFLAITEEHGGLVSERAGEGAQSFANVFGGGLLMTRFGQQAVALDTSGTLAKFNAKKRALFRTVSHDDTYENTT